MNSSAASRTSLSGSSAQCCTARTTKLSTSSSLHREETKKSSCTSVRAAFLAAASPSPSTADRARWGRFSSSSSSSDHAYHIHADDVGKNGEGTGSDITLNIPNGCDNGTVEMVTPQPVDKVRVLWRAAEERVTVMSTSRAESRTSHFTSARYTANTYHGGHAISPRTWKIN
ncbi:hypothetical protein E2C01_016508 [Portunus trituberculatus]|uniref:Uncharacterized protein n=1 Tax=Portunus trituberculatus TaxID=210409 RepID=A0A5B7DQW8_PORTR|nr:hypothetical protein [Portunus trituberculatus]